MDTLGTRAAQALKDAKVRAQHEGRTLSWEEVAAIIDACVTPQPAPPTPSKAGLSATVAAIYAMYPRKVGKEAAVKAIQRAFARLQSREPDALAYLLARTQLYATAVAMWAQEDRQYVPHCATWFNQGRYDDDPREWQRGQPAGNGTRDYSKI